eukprot:TRINITY_DN5130_c0_g1_i1.p1 TRINITY_DN5130_c0_g1~~TRINITY_DN5130_c0_g1_i1.p1  ORF type:complete len:298 (-),score=34.12 TRINITY_DN5130_c0_g1_i1:3-896(-)
MKINVKQAPSQRNQDIILALSVIGLLTSFYLTKDHIDAAADGSLCDISATVSCSVINRSSYSELFNVPIAILGSAWMIALMTVTWKARQNHSDRPFWTVIQYYWSLAGVGFCFYLIFAEFTLGAICPFCTVVHIICFIVAFLAYNNYSSERTKPSLIEVITVIPMKNTILVFALATLHLAPLIYYNVGSQVSEASTTPPPVKDKVAFAKCLTASGVAMYGSDQCPHCLNQKTIFGDAFQHIKYYNCLVDQEACEKAKIERYPTWLRSDGSRVIGTKSFPQLEEFGAPCSRTIKPLSS